MRELPISLGGVVCALVALQCTPTAPDRAVEVRRDAIGEPTDGFPTWAERVVFVWTNRARCDPAADLADCGSCAERACYSPVAPLTWDHNLARSARFHSDDLALGGCFLQHDSPCTLLTDVDILYTPGPCNGDPDCSCVAGTFACGSGGTPWSTRISYFGGIARAENIASGFSDPVSTFYMWLYEPDDDPTCGWRMDNGHRANILGGSSAIGVGKAVTSATWTQDFGSGGAPAGLVSGAHYPRSGADLEFRANWYSGTGPTTAMVNVGGTCYSMDLERGTTTNGTYLAAVAGVPAGCVRYYFHFTDGGGDVYYPTTGSFGISCTDDWDASRPGSCGSCTPDCTGRECGGDGCGGSCGTCPEGLSCDTSGTCVCSDTLCDGACVDTNTDESNCGSCGHGCAPSEFCAGGVCQCLPDCTGRECGDNGCGGLCGSCPAERTCDVSGTCVCTTGTECSGACVNTDADRRNCGDCGVRCRGNQYCDDGVCTRTCRPDCAGRECGDDGCGGSCGTCGATYICDASGSCICSAGLTECGSSCVDTSSDPSNCGRCGTICGLDETCVDGSCTSTCTPSCAGRVCGDDGCGGICGTCPADRSCVAGGVCACNVGTTECAGVCVSTSSDPNNCGDCDVTCAADETCVSGVCTSSCVPDCAGRECGDDGCASLCGTCAADRTCDPVGICQCSTGTEECGGVCVDTTRDRSHCGACDVACAADEGCVEGTCTTSCTGDCVGRECGDDGCGSSCGSCAADQVCNASGRCVCGSGMTDCGGTCVDLDTDPDHCGACDVTCGALETCLVGECLCVPDCAGRECGGNGCGGSCGACGPGEVCSGGTCLCDGSLVDCDGECVEVRTDRRHCGACDTPCAADEVCVASECTTSEPDGGCVPDCAGRECGDDACGGSCGDCSGDTFCAAGGQCLCPEESTRCGESCVDLRSDQSNCGACDHTCAEGVECVASECQETELPDGGPPDGGLPDAGDRDADTTSHDGGARDGGVDADGPPSGGEEGCGCAVPGRGHDHAVAAVATFALLLGALLRRRVER